MFYLIGSTLILCALLFVLDGRRTVSFRPFDPAELGDDPEAFIAAEEAKVSGLREGNQKQFVWHDGIAKNQTKISVVYIHGFTASAGEIRPVPDLVAHSLEANLFFTRLAGHGQGGEALADADPDAWLRDMEEAIAIGRVLGEKVLVISTSTGSAAAVYDLIGLENHEDVLGIVQVSPNYRLKDPRSFILDLPVIRRLAPLIAGRTQKAKFRSEEQAQFWDMEYPTRALIPMASLTRAVRNLDFSKTRLPGLFIYCEDDMIVDPAETRRVMDAWGGETDKMLLDWVEGDDEERHVMTGDILSPARTAPVATRIIAWAKSLQDQTENDNYQSEHGNGQ